LGRGQEGEEGVQDREDDGWGDVGGDGGAVAVLPCRLHG
jgi:hypothetical protein